MKPILTSTLILALTLPAPALAQGLADPAPAAFELVSERVVVPLDTSTGYAVVDVRFGDQGPFALIFDTGASLTVLNKDLATALGLEVTGESFIGDPTDPMANRVDEVTIPELALGDAYFIDMDAVAWERPGNLRRIQRGILGLPTFKDCLVTLDYAKNELRIEKGPLPEANGRDILDVQISEFGLVKLPLVVNGQTVMAHLDSGNPQGVVLPEKLMESLDIVEGTLGAAQAGLASGTLEFKVAQISNPITIGPVTLERPFVSFSDELGHANVGNSFLSQAAVTIDQQSGRMRIRLNEREPAVAAASAGHPRTSRVDHTNPRRPFGIQAQPDATGQRMMISGVSAGSLAERSGVRVGDVLVAVNDTPLTMADRGKPLGDALRQPDAFRLTLERDGQTVELTVPGEDGGD